MAKPSGGGRRPRIPRPPPLVPKAPSRFPATTTVPDTFYSSRAWRSLMARIKRVRGSACEDCGTTSGRIIGDHIVERRDGGEDLDEANIRLLCMGCHARKTAKARAARARRTTY